MADRRARLVERLRIDRRIRHATALAARAWHLVDHVARQSSEHEHRIADLERLASIRTTMDWIAEVAVPTDVLVSVVIVTRNRSELLGRALDTVRDQHHPNWEIVVVDDRNDPTHAGAIDELARGDDRIRVVGNDGAGLAAGRNAGRDAASGAMIAYLDDDNRMHPSWLKAVVWALTQRPDVDVVCGARLIDDYDRARGLAGTSGPIIQFEPVDPRVLELRMQTDIGCIAHRDVVRVRSDERYARNDDWDWLRRTLVDHRHLDLPCIAQTYTTTAPGRLSRALSSDETSSTRPPDRRGRS